MKIFICYTVIFILPLSFLFTKNEHPSIHQQQSERYKKKDAVPIDKVHVLTGLDVLLDRKVELIQGKSVALVTNHTGIDKMGIPNYKHFIYMKNVDLKVIFSPEHGFFGGESDTEKVFYKNKNKLQTANGFDSLLENIEVEIVKEVVFIDHKVRLGESLWLIARKYDVRIQDIVSINKLAMEKYIHPGQILQIPADGYDIYRKSAIAKSSSSQQIYYTVRYGDMLSEIAVKYRTSVKKIKKWNRLRSDRIYSGQKLKIWTELPRVISLYGKTNKPTAEMLSGVDLIIYDIQDIGTRFNKYITTLGLVMEAAGELDIPIIVLDRPNPIRGDIIEGPALKLEYQSSFGYYPIAIRYGGTVGDLAKLIIKQNWINEVPVLTVIPNEGWNNQLWFDETDLRYISSSNMPNLQTAIVYPGMCLIEGTNVSEGRGTHKPFQWIGAPWINGQDLSKELNKFNLSGVVFAPISFTPKSISGEALQAKYENQKCNGIEVRILDRNVYRSVDTGVIALFTLFNMYPEKFKLLEQHLNRLWGSNELYKEIKKGTSPLNFIKTYKN